MRRHDRWKEQANKVKSLLTAVKLPDALVSIVAPWLVGALTRSELTALYVRSR